MNFGYRTFASAAVLTAMIGFGSSAATAGAIIYNAAGDLALGVNTLGHLNTSYDQAGNYIDITSNASATGIASFFDRDGNGATWQDATAPGCLCEGWGVSANNTDSGTANVSGGTYGLGLDSFTSSATNITSIVHLSSMAGLSVTQSYGVSAATDRLFQDTVTITNNTGGTLTDVKYVRVMDWDVPPTEFGEMVTIQGTASTAELEESDNNGFSSSDPLVGIGSYGLNNVDFVDQGPRDHGAYFRFNFGALADGESKTFSIFYGAASTEALANAAVAAAGLELYSYGQSYGGELTGSPATFIFGFKGVGGVIQIPSVPEPMSAALFGLGLLGLGLRRKYRR